jgi:AcrR family transcriptional regulator
MPPGRSNARGAGTRARILSAAVACLGEGGIDDVRIARVAERAGISTASVHYHFDTRESLLAAAIEHSFEVAGDVRTSTKYGSGSALERLRRKVEASLPLDARRRREWELWVELWLRAVREPELRATSAEVYAQLHRGFRALIAEGTETGEFAVADPDAAAERILAAIDGYGLRVMLEDPTVPPARALDAVWTQVEQELLTPARR